jgi:Protein of unknown function (DUF2971)
LQYYYGHTMPNFTAETLDDALFHYTSASGLTGILQENSIWCTSAFCSNDESELAVGENVLSHQFRNLNHRLRREKDPRVELFDSRGIDFEEYAGNFSELLISEIFGKIGVFIACFCKPASELDFNNGLLSQWRGYGQDGGYAIQFSKKKLLSKIDEKTEGGQKLNFSDVFYSEENRLKTQLIQQMDTIIQEYDYYLNSIAQPITFESKSLPSPLGKIAGEPLAALLSYLIYTKNQHFGEERESRLCHVMPLKNPKSTIRFFNRNGLIVPYIKTEKSFDLLSCVEGVIVGPNARMDARLRSSDLLIQSLGLSISVRPSQIPFTRV